MKRSIALLAGLALMAGAGAALAHGGHGGGHGGGHFSGGGHVGFHVTGTVHSGPRFVGHPHFFPRHTVFVGGVFVAAPYPYYYYPPAYYPPPAYEEPPTYVEQGDDVRYYCPDYRDYYPNVPNCPSPWLQVVPGAGGYTR